LLTVVNGSASEEGGIIFLHHLSIIDGRRPKDNSFYIYLGGLIGGGYGSPLERDLRAIERDARCGYVSQKAAEEFYGAVFQPNSLAIDSVATEKRRQTMRAKGLPHDNPIAETPLPFAAAPPQ
jgi:hypothetical protein